MNADLTRDLQNQQLRLQTLANGRLGLRDGSAEAIKVDLEMMVTRNLIQSYETLKNHGG